MEANDATEFFYSALVRGSRPHMELVCTVARVTDDRGKVKASSRMQLPATLG